MSTKAGSGLIQSVFVERQADLALDPVPTPRSAPSRSRSQQGPRGRSGGAPAAPAVEPRSAVYDVAPRRANGFVVRPNDAPAKVWTADDPYEYEGQAEEEQEWYQSAEGRGEPALAQNNPDAGERKRRARSRQRRQQQQQQQQQQPPPPSLMPPPSPAPEEWKPGAFGSTPSFLGGRDGRAPHATGLPPAPTLHRTAVNLAEVGQANLEGLGAGLSSSFLGRHSNNVSLGAARGLNRAPPSDDVFAQNAPLPPLGAQQQQQQQQQQPGGGNGNGRALQIDADITHFLKTAPIGPQAMAMGRQLLRHLLKMHDLPMRHGHGGSADDGAAAQAKTSQILQRFLDNAIASLRGAGLGQQPGTAAAGPPTASERELHEAALGEALMSEAVVQAQLDAYCANTSELRSTVAGHFRELLTSLPELLAERNDQIRELAGAEKALLTQAAELRARLEGRRAELEAAGRRLAEAAQKREELDGRVAALEEALDEALGSELAASSRAEETEATLQGAREQGAKEGAAAAGRLAREVRESSRLRQELMMAKEQCEQLDHLCKGQQSDVAELAKVREELENERKRLAPLEARVRQSNIAAKTMVEECNRATTARDEALKALAEGEKRFNERGSVRRLKEKFEQQIKDLREEAFRAKTGLAAAQRELGVLKHSTEKEKAELIELRLLKSGHDDDIKREAGKLKQALSDLEMEQMRASTAKQDAKVDADEAAAAAAARLAEVRAAERD
jgi:hypothetical protein